MRLIPDGNTASHEPVLKLRWCLDKHEVESLKSANAKNISILIVVLYQDSRLEERYLVPIDEMMTFISFRKPGDHLVMAKVVYGKNIESFILRKDGHRTYYNDCLHYTRDEEDYSKIVRIEFEDMLDHFDSSRDIDYKNIDHYFEMKSKNEKIRTEISVVVPKEHFPKEPPVWLKNLANHSYEYPAIDPCMFRRRCLALPLRIPFYLLGAIISTTMRIVAAILFTFLGFRDINYRAIFHPWQNSMIDVWEGIDGLSSNWFFTDKNGKWRPLRYILIHPIVITVVGGGIFLISEKLKMNLLQMVLYLFRKIIDNGYYVTLGLLAGAAFIGILYLISKKIKSITLKKDSKEYKELMKTMVEQEYDELYKLLACKTTPIVATVEALPKKKRTIKLRYLDLKAKVCRPYAS